MTESRLDTKPMTGGNTPLHQSALVGWRGKVSEALAGPLSRRTPLSADQVRIVLALTFFASSEARNTIALATSSELMST